MKITIEFKDGRTIVAEDNKKSQEVSHTKDCRLSSKDKEHLTDTVHFIEDCF